ncbi:MAG: PKD domain-containing protein, partial [Bacteroidota bacterium]
MPKVLISLIGLIYLIFSFAIRGNFALPEAKFNADIKQGCTPFEVQFFDQSTGDVDTWLWTFPGGDPSSSSEQNPIVTYNQAGIFDVILEVTNDAGSDQLTDTAFILVENTTIADFSFIPDMLSVKFQNQSMFFDSLVWNFGDGNTSEEVNPTHTYASEGNYIVQLITYNFCSSDTAVILIDLILNPTGGFGSDKSEGCAPLGVQFFDQSSGSVDAWEWVFEGGDPMTSSDQNPFILYVNVGSFDVQLITSNSAGSDTTLFSDFITILPEPISDFDFMIFQDSIQFINLSEFGDTYHCDFGEGTSSNEFEPSPVYETAGLY